MSTYCVFQSATDPDLRGFTDDPTGARLPREHGPWTLVQQVGLDEEWTFDIGKAVVAAGILENGFVLSDGSNHLVPAHPIIASDRVEGTAVFDPQGHQIGTIKRLLIEKVSGRVEYVDLVFGGFLGMGVHHHTIPWEKLTYDRELHGYRTDITEAQVRGAPTLSGDDQVWADRKREQEIRDDWSDVL
jgi:PRC-barrel domain